MSGATMPERSSPRPHSPWPALVLPEGGGVDVLADEVGRPSGTVAAGRGVAGICRCCGPALAAVTLSALVEVARTVDGAEVDAGADRRCGPSPTAVTLCALVDDACSVVDEATTPRLTSHGREAGVRGSRGPGSAGGTTNAPGAGVST